MISTPEEHGEYDQECNELFKALEAEGVLLCVCKGKRGSGFSACLTEELAGKAPAVLRKMADMIEADAKAAANN